MPSPVIASDLDGTLSSHETWRGVHAWLTAFRPTFAVRRFVWVRIPTVIAFRLGLVAKERFRAGWLADQAGLFRGLREDELAAMGEWVVEQHLWPARRTAGIDAVASTFGSIRAERPGAQLLLATGGYQQVGEAFARRIGAMAALGTPLEMIDDRATGRLAAPTQSGEQNAAAVRTYAAGAPILAAFGDTAADIPLLAAAQRAVAVAPDAQLRGEAVRRGWEIVG